MTEQTNSPSDNIKSNISRAYTETRTSKAGKPYNVLVVSFLRPNDKIYEFTTFLTNEQLALIESSVPLPGSI